MTLILNWSWYTMKSCYWNIVFTETGVRIQPRIHCYLNGEPKFLRYRYDGKWDWRVCRSVWCLLPCSTSRVRSRYHWIKRLGSLLGENPRESPIKHEPFTVQPGLIRPPDGDTKHSATRKLRCHQTNLNLRPFSTGLKIHVCVYCLTFTRHHSGPTYRY